MARSLEVEEGMNSNMNGMARVRWIGDGQDVLDGVDESGGCCVLDDSDVVVKRDGRDERCLDASMENDE